MAPPSCSRSLVIPVIGFPFGFDAMGDRKKGFLSEEDRDDHDRRRRMVVLVGYEFV